MPSNTYGMHSCNENENNMYVEVKRKRGGEFKNTWKLFFFWNRTNIWQSAKHIARPILTILNKHSLNAADSKFCAHKITPGINGVVIQYIISFVEIIGKKRDFFNFSGILLQTTVDGSYQYRICSLDY